MKRKLAVGRKICRVECRRMQQKMEATIYYFGVEGLKEWKRNCKPPEIYGGHGERATILPSRAKP